MLLKTKIAKLAASTSRFVLKNILRRQAGFYPGKIALSIDDKIFDNLVLNFGSNTMLITGTNGKTSVTALMADCLSAERMNVCTNSTGANLASGIASSMLEFKSKNIRRNFGVFEIDELWVEKVLPQIRSGYLVLLNLFPDQVDRFGSIKNIQESILNALKQSPTTILIYNADDPNCQIIADQCENNTVPFGVAEKISKIDDNSIHKCPQCDADLFYKVHQYAQIGKYRCPNCGFNTAGVKYSAKKVKLTSDTLSFEIAEEKYSSAKAVEYALYNYTAFVAAAKTLYLRHASINHAIKNQKSENGRMQYFDIGHKQVMINLAKNPVGFNQNINYIFNKYNSSKNPEKTSIAFFANKKEGDGKDPSWLYQVDFSPLKDMNFANIYYGGQAADTLGAALKKSDVIAHKVLDAQDVLETDKTAKKIYIIANYTAMFPLRDQLIKLSQ